jgi:hypothetical protein
MAASLILTNERGLIVNLPARESNHFDSNEAFRRTCGFPLETSQPEAAVSIFDSRPLSKEDLAVANSNSATDLDISQTRKIFVDSSHLNRHPLS